MFVSYSHRDEDLWDQLQIHLTMLKREGAIDVWHDRRIPAGDEIDPVISEALEEAHVILLLVSPDFLASSYCYEIEMRRAMERHEAGEARVLPVILRPCEWQRAPFAKLRATPRDGRPIVKWPNLDDAFLDVVRDIRRAVEETTGRRPAKATRTNVVQAAGSQAQAGPRSSNLRVRKVFTEADKDRFLDQAFEYMARFFESSAQELAERYADIETTFQRIDARRFVCVIYRNGKAQSRCKIVLRGPFDGIAYSSNDSAADNSCNETLSVLEAEQTLYLHPGMGAWFNTQGREQLTFEGAAEYYWGRLIEPLQQ